MVYPLSLEALRLGTSKPEEVPPTIELAAAGGVIAFVNEHLRFRRAKQIEGIVRNPPETEEHYFVPFVFGSLGNSILDAVVAAFVAVGWKHSKVVHDHIVIARTPYEVPLGRGGLAGVELPLMVSPASADLSLPNENQVPHHAGGYSHHTAAVAAH